MTTDKQARKERPVTRGVLDYFPDAITEVANVSYVGNQQHNPGQEMHWARGKSADHADCVARHLIERGTIDEDGLRHSAKMAWRALALLQIEIENDRKKQHDGEAAAYESGTFEPSVGHKDPQEAPSENGGAFHVYEGSPPFVAHFDRPEREADFNILIGYGCPRETARQIVAGTTYAKREPGTIRRVAYVGGPMRGYPKFNFPRFDQARDELLSLGYDVISPADIDRAAGDVNETAGTHTADQTDFALRDFWALLFIKKIDQGGNVLSLLPHWEKSTGANAELGIAKWIGLSIVGV